MPTQLQLDGPDLEVLLARVRSELGPSARIVLAEKVRSGGVGGFFARQRFEITVEVDDPAAPGTDDPPAGAAAPTRPTAQSGTPTSVLDLVDALSDSFVASSGSDRPTGGHGGSVSRSAGAPVSTEGARFADVLARLGVAAGAPGTDAPPPAHTGPAGTGLLPAQRRPPSDSSELTGPAGAVSTAGVALHDGAPPPPARLAPGAVPPVPTRPTPAAGVPALTRLGLPHHLQPQVGEAGLYPALVRSLTSLPRAPRPTNRAGAVLAVVGPTDLALDVADDLAWELGLPVSSVVLATSRQALVDMPERQVVRGPDEAAERRSVWRRRRNLTIVAVAAPLTAVGASQARAYRSVLDPGATWGAVEATRKPLDVGAFARAVGGLDALALSSVEETADPAAVLHLGIPVGRLGGRKATASAWAALLAGRLAA